MWRQWPSSYRLGDEPIRSTQHEYRFPTIIQLDEVGPPPPSSQKALLSPVTSSSQSYDYYSSSEECEEVEGVEDEEEDEEEATESYCSSDPSGPRLGAGDPERASATVKMSRVLAWRNSFDSVFNESDAGMFCLCPSTPFLLPAGSPHLAILVPTFTYPVSPYPRTCHHPHPGFFSRNLRSAVLMSLKRKYSHEMEEGENEEVDSQPGSGKTSHAVSSFPPSQRLFSFLGRPFLPFHTPPIVTPFCHSFKTARRSLTPSVFGLRLCLMDSRVC